MENDNKLKALYDSGRFECDLFFYQELIRVLNDLDLYQFVNFAEENLAKVQKIRELTEKHLNKLENQDNEEEAAIIIKQVNNLVKTIDTETTHSIMKQIEAMGGKSYKQKMIALIKKQPFKKPYLQICEKLLNSAHDPKLLLNDLSTLCIFMGKNQDKIQQFTDIYQIVLTKGVEQLKKFRGYCQFIHKNPELKQQAKVKTYIQGSYILFHVLIRFNQIYKLLTKDNKFGLKLGSLKHEIEAENKNNFQLHSVAVNVQQFRETLIDSSKKFSEVCSLCLRAPGDHPQCFNTIKLFYKKSNDQ